MYFSKKETVYSINKDQYDIEIRQDDDKFGRMTVTLFFYNNRTHSNLLDYIVGMIRVSELLNNIDSLKIGEFYAYGNIYKIDDYIKATLTSVFWRDENGMDKIEKLINQMDEFSTKIKNLSKL